MVLRRILVILGFLSFDLIGQDTTVTWLRNIDTLQFKVYYNKKQIPKEILKYIEVDKLKEIANPGRPYRAGCIGPEEMPHIRLNWIAKDKKEHVVMSISMGGRGRRTCFYYLDHDKTTPNINELSFGHSFKEVTALTFGETVKKIKNHSFAFEEYDEPYQSEKD